MEEKVIKIICDYQKISPEKVSAKSRLMQDIGLSSFDVLNLVCSFEEEFDVEIPDRMITEVRTVNDIINAIKQL